MTARPDFNHRVSDYRLCILNSDTPDVRPAVPCVTCGRTCLTRTPDGRCRGCATTRNVEREWEPGTPNLDAIRRGTWRPNPITASVLGTTSVMRTRQGGGGGVPYASVKTAEEIAVCPVCDRVRLKSVGWPCNGCLSGRHQGRDTATAQKTLFGEVTV